MKKKKTQADLEKVWQDNHELCEKLRDLEDRSRRDNIRIDGLEQYENERWEETEERAYRNILKPSRTGKCENLKMHLG